MTKINLVLVYTVLLLLFIHLGIKIYKLESNNNYETFKNKNNYDILKEGHKQCLLHCKKLKDQGNLLRKKKKKKKNKKICKNPNTPQLNPNQTIINYP